MTNTKAQRNAVSADVNVIMRHQKRLISLHRKHGTWRAVADHLNLPNHSYLIDFVLHDKVPANYTIRRLMGIPRMLPSERKAQEKVRLPRVGEVGWEQHYLKKVKK